MRAPSRAGGARSAAPTARTGLAHCAVVVLRAGGMADNGLAVVRDPQVPALLPEQPENKFHGFSTGSVARFALRSVSSCRLENLGGCKSPLLLGSCGGRTRDRTLDLSRVKGTLSR
jgi:hypothetical protein